jgi:hypothetical protein
MTRKLDKLRQDIRDESTRLVEQLDVFLYDKHNNRVTNLQKDSLLFKLESLEGMFKQVRKEIK